MGQIFFFSFFFGGGGGGGGLKCQKVAIKGFTTYVLTPSSISELHAFHRDEKCLRSDTGSLCLIPPTDEEGVALV